MSPSAGREVSGWQVARVAVICLVGLWLFLTVVAWIFDQGVMPRPKTLAGMFVSQWEFIRSLRIW